MGVSCTIRFSSTLHNWKDEICPRRQGSSLVKNNLSFCISDYRQLMAHSKKVEKATWTKQWNCNKRVFIKDTRRPPLSDKSFNLTNWRQFLCVCPLIDDKITSWAEGLNGLKKCKHWNVCLFLNWRNLSSYFSRTLIDFYWKMMQFRWLQIWQVQSRLNEKLSSRI